MPSSYCLVTVTSKAFAPATDLNAPQGLKKPSTPTSSTSHPASTSSSLRLRPGGREALLGALEEPDRAKRHKLLHHIFDGYAATSDAPGAVFPADLMDMYPDAAIVLN